MNSKIYYRFFQLIFFAGIILISSCKKDPEPEPIPEPPPVLTCNLNITGGCLDQWANVDDGYGNVWMEPVGGFLGTLNQLYSLPASLGGPGPLTVDSTIDKYSGIYAAKLTTKMFSPTGTNNILIPGLLGAANLDIANQTIHIGKPYTQKPTSFQGYFKYAPVNGDSALIEVYIHKYNVALHKRDTIGYVRKTYNTTVSNYTAFNLALNYNPAYASLTPDSVSILMVSSAGINLNSLQNCVGQVGSTLWIDEVSFILP
ncbi:MAG: PCMD domain-containing protein [Bacteroidetes bacterium]|nr:PCMD domain-containing protein [Bacteroidota bacterium]